MFPKVRWIHSLAVILAAVAADSTLVGDEPDAPSNGTGATAIPIQFIADMLTDPLRHFGHRGDVTWTAGRLVLAPASSMWPDCEPTCRLELNADFDIPTGMAPWRTEFHVPLAKQSALVLTTGRDANGIESILIDRVDLDQGEAKSEHLLVAQPSSVLRSGHWCVRFNYGLLTLSIDGRGAASAYIDYVRPVGGIILWPKIGTLTSSRIEYRADPRSELPLSPEKMAQHQAAVAAQSRAKKLLDNQGDPRAAQEAQVAYDGFLRVYGARDPLTLRAKRLWGHALLQQEAEYSRGRQVLDEMLQTASQVFGEDHPELADAWSSIAGGRLVVNDSAGALEAYERVVRILSRAGLPSAKAQGVALIQAAYAAQSAGQTAYAMRRAQAAVQILELCVGKNDPVTADAHREYGSLLSQAGNFQAAREHLRQAAQIYAASEPDSSTNIDIRHRLAELAIAEGNYAGADDEFRDALEAANRIFGADSDIGAHLIGMRATMAAELKRPTQAMALASESLSMVRRVHPESDMTTARALALKAGVHESIGDYQNSVALQSEALAIHLQTAVRTLPGLSEAEGIEFVQQLYRARDMLLSTFERLPDTPPQLVYDAVWHSRALLSQMLELRWRYRGATAEAQAEIDELRQLHQQIATLVLAGSADRRVQQRLEQVSRRSEQLERDLQKRLVLKLPDSLAKRVELDQLARSLPPKTAVIDFVRTTAGREQRSSYHAFVLVPDASGQQMSVHWLRLGKAAEIEQAVAAWRFRLHSPRGLSWQRIFGQDVEPRAAADRLRSLVWQPIEPYLQKIEHVIVVPDAALARVPWGALPGNEPQRQLIESFAFSTASHGRQILSWLDETETDDLSGHCLLVGGLDYENADPIDAQATIAAPAPNDSSKTTLTSRFKSWKKLPGTFSEITAIGAQFRNSRDVVTINGPHATKEAILKGLVQSQYVHFATHGFFEPPSEPAEMVVTPQFQEAGWLVQSIERPVRPTTRHPLSLAGLVLSGANTTHRMSPDGLSQPGAAFLTAQEVVALDLANTNLVVLSACETGLGDSAGGEGGIQPATSVRTGWRKDVRCQYVASSRSADKRLDATVLRELLDPQAR